MRLYFLRHAQAEERGRVDDYSRALTERGRKRMEVAARLIEALGLGLNAIYSSPRLRAKQTAEIISQALDLPVKLDPSIGEFDWGLGSLAGLLATHHMRDSIMIVGHEPTFSETIGAITGGMVVMKKGGLARVDVYTHNPTRGSLVWMIAPRIFDELRKEKGEEPHG